MLLATSRGQVATWTRISTLNLRFHFEMTLVLRTDRSRGCMQTLTLRGVLAFKPKSSRASVKWDIYDSRKTEVSPQGLRSSKVCRAGLWAIGATPWCIWKTVA